MNKRPELKPPTRKEDAAITAALASTVRRLR
jgi:hypothetical protein